MKSLKNAIFTLVVSGLGAGASAQSLQTINDSGFEALPVNSTISMPGPFVVNANADTTLIFDAPVHYGDGGVSKLTCYFIHDASPDRRQATNGVHLMVVRGHEGTIDGKGFPTAITGIKCNSAAPVGQFMEGLSSVHGSLTLPPATEMQ
jgi:hypothetical protein